MNAPSQRLIDHNALMNRQEPRLLQPTKLLDEGLKFGQAADEKFPLFSISDVICQRHPESPLSLYCLTDSVLLCGYCMRETHLSCDGGNHLSHSVAKKSKILQNSKKAVFNLRRQLKFFIDSLLVDQKLTRDVVQSHYIPTGSLPRDRQIQKSTKTSNKRKRKQI